MDAQRASHLAWLLTLASVAMTGAGVAMLMTFDWTSVPEDTPPPGPVAVFHLAALAFPSVGALIAVRRPEHRLGWIFCAIGVLFSLSVLCDAPARYGVYQRPVEHASWISWLGGMNFTIALLLMFTFVLLLFPTGHLPSRRWRIIGWLDGGAIVLVALISAVVVDELPDNPGISNPAAIDLPDVAVRTVEFMALIGIGAAILSSLASLVVRFRAARGVVRQQMKWFVYVAMVVASVLVAGTATASLVTLPRRVDDLLWAISNVGGVIALPGAVGIAILRYRLYDIDRLINRTLVYGALTVSLAVVYLALVIGLGGIMRSLTGESSSMVVAVSTLVVAALFRPLRWRAQRAVDRRFYRHKYDASRTLEVFSHRLRDEIDLEALSIELRAVVQETMQPVHVSLWLCQRLRLTEGT